MSSNTHNSLPLLGARDENLPLFKAATEIIILFILGNILKCNGGYLE
jgi:hypothetical protein